MNPDEQWKWQAIRWSILCFPAFILLVSVSIGLCCCYCKCCKRCCPCCRKNKNPGDPLSTKPKDKKVSPVNEGAEENNNNPPATNPSGNSHQKEILEDEQNIELTVQSFDDKVED